VASDLAVEPGSLSVEATMKTVIGALAVGVDLFTFVGVLAWAFLRKDDR
jgi:hypothetical protein